MKTFLRTALAASGLTAALIGIGNANAAFTFCRTDPIVTLSNGAHITMIDNVSDATGDIKSAAFQLHIPAGLTVTSVAYDSTYGSLESFSWTADQKPGAYREVTTVTTGSTGIKVQATATLTGIACNQPAKWQNGSTGKTLTVPFNC